MEDSAVARPRVVSICGPSSADVNATWRAALVARDLGAALHILHPAPGASVRARIEASMRELAADIQARTGIEAALQPVAGSVIGRAAVASSDADLVVLASARAHPLREWIGATPAQRLVRLGRCPVLVVKRPALGPYRRVLVPVALEADAVSLMDLACALSRGSRAEVLHVLDPADEAVLLGMRDAQEALSSFRQHRAQGAYLAIHHLMSSSSVGGVNLEGCIEFGDATAVALARSRESDAELTAVGNRRGARLGEWPHGGMTQRVLAGAASDVLVQPWPAGRRADATARVAGRSAAVPR